MRGATSQSRWALDSGTEDEHFYVDGETQKPTPKNCVCRAIKDTLRTGFSDFDLVVAIGACGAAAISPLGRAAGRQSLYAERIAVAGFDQSLPQTRQTR